MPIIEHKSSITLRSLAITSFYIGLTGYGGPAILGHMKKVFIDRKKWVDESLFMTGLSLSQMLPGATGVNLMEFLGYQLAGIRGAIIASTCFAAPAFFLMTALSAIYFSLGKLPFIHALFIGLAAVVVALLINATFLLGRSALKDFRAVGIAILAFIGVQFFHLHILLIILISALLGSALYSGQIRKQSVSEQDPQEPPPIAPSSWTVWIGALIGIGLVVLLELNQHSQVTKLVSSMIRVGVTAFGGGFTSIPLFQHEAVALHHWLTPKQFLDGIALGQVTPGPVLITATFIGYRLLGIPGAALATLTIFAPSGLAMLWVAGKYEHFSRQFWVKAMLQGILAGFIGVLLTIILRLAGQSLTDWKTISLFGIALAVLLVAKKDPLWVILGGAVVSPLLFL